jgi:dTDP-4-dehydrorhamnose 3,5-epimerase
MKSRRSLPESLFFAASHDTDAVAWVLGTIVGWMVLLACLVRQTPAGWLKTGMTMRFIETELQDAFILELEEYHDARGFFARSFCANEFAAHGLNAKIVQCNISYNAKRGTLRGMHYQIPPAAETKVVRCVRGAIHDVIVDMRPESPTFLFNVGIELSAENRRALYIPELFAHGFQTLTDDVEVEYQMSEFYEPQFSRGLCYDDPVLCINWPLPVSIISPKDLAWSQLTDVVRPGY